MSSSNKLKAGTAIAVALTFTASCATSDINQSDPATEPDEHNTEVYFDPSEQREGFDSVIDLSLIHI